MSSFDYVVLGGGIGGLSIASLLAKLGKKVCVLEKSHEPGGWARPHTIGAYQFVPGAQYLNGAEPGGSLQRFLSAIGITDLKFNNLSSEGYDIAMSRDTMFAIPSGIQQLKEKLQHRFPDEATAIADYFQLTETIFNEVNLNAGIVHLRKVLSSPWAYRTFVRHLGKTPSDIFERFRFSRELRFILYSQGGDLGLPSNESSFPLLSALHAIYGRSAVFPARGIGDLVRRISDVIRQSPGCEIVCDCEVRQIHHAGAEVTGVETSKGYFVAKRQFISNLDPLLTYRLAGKSVQSIEYSDSPFILNLCFEGSNLAEYGFGRHNYWLHGPTDPDHGFRQLRENMVPSDPWIFLSTPSFTADPGTIAPIGSSSMTMLTFVPFAKLKALRNMSTSAAAEFSYALREQFFQTLHQRFRIPASLITAWEWKDPQHWANDIGTPDGNVYGPALSPKNYSLFKIGQRSKFRNLSFNGAASAFPGIMPICVGAMDLCDQLLANEAGYEPLLSAHTSRKAS